jgi:fucose permease
LASVLLNSLGRRGTLILASAMFAITFVLLGTASLHESYVAILVSRGMVGSAVGFCMPAAQIYVSFFLIIFFYFFGLIIYSMLIYTE